MTWEDETRSYYMKHKGETCLIVGLGTNLLQTPPEWFSYPSFGVNTLCKYADYQPTYYVGVDMLLFRKFGAEIQAAYQDVPKFVPTLDLDAIEGDNFYRFRRRRENVTWKPWDVDALVRGIAFDRVMGAVFQLAYFMGFTTMLLIGIEHKPGEEAQHFWGFNPYNFQGLDPAPWFDEYRHYSHLEQATVLNISPDTYVPDSVIPRDDWRKWLQ